jgi:hypothetical protein
MHISLSALKKSVVIGSLLTLSLALASQIQAAVMLRQLAFDAPQEIINSSDHLGVIFRWVNMTLDVLVGTLYAYLLLRENPLSGFAMGVFGAGLVSLIVRAVANIAAFLFGPVIIDLILWDRFASLPSVFSDSLRSLPQHLGATLYVSLIATIAGMMGGLLMTFGFKKLLHPQDSKTTP